jgi:hypothetical protein
LDDSWIFYCYGMPQGPFDPSPPLQLLSLTSFEHKSLPKNDLFIGFYTKYMVRLREIIKKPLDQKYIELNVRLFNQI